MYCQYAPIKCEAFEKCRTKTLRKDIDLHQAVCPYVQVPCIYCHVKVERVGIMEHEANDCEGTYTCNKCGMAIKKEETQKNSHHCFNALAGYLQNMLASKDFVITVFKEEIDKKNQLIEQLLQRQEELDSRLQRMEEVLAFNDKNGTIEEEKDD